ncbi:MAG: S8 family serine peptidase, partial [Limisphaerales bacterium]
FKFKEPRAKFYRIETNAAAAFGTGAAAWLKAWPQENGYDYVEIGKSFVVQLEPGRDLKKLLAGTPLQLSRTLATNIFVLEAPEAWTALKHAQRLAELPEVLVSSPITRPAIGLHGGYAFKSNDPYSPNQWHLEQRDANGRSLGVDLNARAAWPYTHGEGVTIGIADEAAELTHPELAARAANSPHFNLITSTTDPMLSDSDKHANAVAGLAVAELNNQLGGSGVAPAAHFASWRIFNTNGARASDLQLMDMFQYFSNSVAVQNHSWGNSSAGLYASSFTVNLGIANAIQFGRGGRGVIMVRSAGNSRSLIPFSPPSIFGNANDSGYASDPRVITVGAVRLDGRTTRYSSPGACLLVAAPSGESQGDGVSRDSTFPSLFTTDRQGEKGYNFPFYPSDPTLWDYCFDNTGFSGTSGSVPQIAGIAALVLSVNPNLTYRDVQQILIHASRHFDFSDPDLTMNGAGFLVSHNDAFGIPDAGFAASLARNWISRPALTTRNFDEATVRAIPDDGLRVLIPDAPPNVQSIRATPSFGPHADSPTPILPLIDVGLAGNPLTNNLIGKAALIQRGGNAFTNKIQFAADAGAAFAIIYNNVGTTNRLIMGSTDYVPIPAVFISKDDGDALHNYLLQMNPSAQIKLFPATYSFMVTNTLLCEHVGVRIQTDHSFRGDILLTLLSPQGTRSVVQRLNTDTNTGPADWTYYSTHHFYESSFGTWTVEISDESAGLTGNCQFASLILKGVPITDSDHDGLDDNWEMAQFGSLLQNAKGDPDKDGYNNMREQIRGTNPNAMDVPFQLDLSRANENLARLSWPSSTNFNYAISMGTEVTNLTVTTNLAGTFPETEFFLNYTNLANQFFKVTATARP